MSSVSWKSDKVAVQDLVLAEILQQLQCRVSGLSKYKRSALSVYSNYVGQISGGLVVVSKLLVFDASSNA